MAELNGILFPRAHSNFNPKWTPCNQPVWASSRYVAPKWREFCPWAEKVPEMGSF